MHVCAHHVGQRQSISLQPRTLLSSVSVVCLCTSNNKHYLPFSAFYNRVFLLISSSEFSFWLPCSKCTHLVLMTLKQLAADKSQARMSGGVLHTHTRTHTHPPRPDLSPLLLCNLLRLKCFLLQHPFQARPQAPEGCSPDLPSVRMKAGGGGRFAQPCPRGGREISQRRVSPQRPAAAPRPGTRWLGVRGDRELGAVGSEDGVGDVRMQGCGYNGGSRRQEEFSEWLKKFGLANYVAVKDFPLLFLSPPPPRSFFYF